MNMQISTITDILPKLIEEGRDNIVAQSRFLQRINKAKEITRINPGGLFTPYTTLENDTAFGVAEGGAILGGGAPEYVMASVNIRQHWASMSWTGGLERIKSNHLTEIRRDQRFEGMSNAQLERVAQNMAVKDTVMSALKMFARRENYFALQGTDKSPIGVITGLPGSNVVQFSWDSTNIGNRMFQKNQQIVFYSSGGAQRTTGLPAGAQYSTVTAKVDKTAASGATGPVQFDLIPTAGIAVGDTAHYRGSFGLFPTGVLHYVDDTGSFKGQTRSTNPDVFASVVNRLSGTPTIAPIYIRELESQMQSKVGYDVPLALEYWMNKTQLFNWQSQIYSSPFTRFIGAEKVKAFDMSVGEAEWDGKQFNIDPDVPPGHVNALNMAAWRKITQTPVQPYQYDGGQLIVNPINANGERLDARQSTIFSEYNWDCEDARSQGRIEGLAFSRVHI